jgi:hypothetical protein
MEVEPHTPCASRGLHEAFMVNEIREVAAPGHVFDPVRALTRRP